MTNFFGSVMEMIHTDSAYSILSRKESPRVEIEMSADKSFPDEKRLMENPSHSDQISELNIEVKLNRGALLLTLIIQL